MSGEAYRSLGNSQLGANKLLTAPTMQSLYDNLLAALRGAPDAPRLDPWALQGTVTVGNSLRYRDPRVSFTSVSDSSRDSTPFFVTLMCSGDLRVRCTHGKVSSSESEMRIRRYRPSNDTVATLGSWENDGGDVERLVDVNVQFGDSIFVDHRRRAGTTVYVSNFKISTGGEYFWILPPGMIIPPTQPT